MLQFLTSLSFFYFVCIVLITFYAIAYFRSFAKTRRPVKGFLLVFGIIGFCCLGFLYIHIHPPGKLKTYTNLDHHFIQHDGYLVKGSIELGNSDTANFSSNPYNSFVFERSDNGLKVSSEYSEEPFYLRASDGYQIASVNFPASNTLQLNTDTLRISIQTNSDENFIIQVDEKPFSVHKKIKWGINAWNLFKENNEFINSSFYSDEKLSNGLKSVYILRNNISKTQTGDLCYFISGRIFRAAKDIHYDNKQVVPASLQFSSLLQDKSQVAWGIGFVSNNKNQYRIVKQDQSFQLINKYPLSYPLTREKTNSSDSRIVNKFIVADNKDLLEMPAVFKEGFLFNSTGNKANDRFAPVVLSYNIKEGGKTPDINIRRFQDFQTPIKINDQHFDLSAESKAFSWLFSIRNTFDWNFGGFTLSSARWQILMFGSLAFFILLVFLAGSVQKQGKKGWVWQLMSCVLLILLTTRFFLYWRYKTFPPYEDLDLPSLQQLNSFWNFGIIIIATVLLAVVLGYSAIQSILIKIGGYTASLIKVTGIRFQYKGCSISKGTQKFFAGFERIIKNNSVIHFLLVWFAILILAGGYAALRDFDITASRHLAIILILLYFLFLYLSYRFSPLVNAAEKSWWQLNTGKRLDLIISNPIKVLLSLSLLAVFAFIDIGFAIIFLNFLFFNEAFLCINYGIGGLSSGSKKNAKLFLYAGGIYLTLFVTNLAFGPYIINYLLELPDFFFTIGYGVFAVFMAAVIVRLLHKLPVRKRVLTGVGITVILFAGMFLFFPKSSILDKAAMTRYRVDVMIKPADKVIEKAYADGKNYTPVIRAAQNQWFINTFVFADNNPFVNKNGFHLLPQAPQNKGAKYNAQATDLVASRFLIAEHGKWSAVFFVLLLLLPVILLASYYKLYPDFTNRTSHHYPAITTGFSLLNYVVIMALLVILAATGRYIFFGQDLPFGSILSKQSILFPVAMILLALIIFKKTNPEQYPDRRKLIPGLSLFAGLIFLLFTIWPAYHKNREFTVSGIAANMDQHIEFYLQPVLDYLDTSASTRKLSMMQKDKLFSDSVRKMLRSGYLENGGEFFVNSIALYARSGFSAHMDDSRLLYLDIHSGKPRLAVNDNYFRIEPPPHLQQYWAGSVYGDSSVYNITAWDSKNSDFVKTRIDNYNDKPSMPVSNGIQFVFTKKNDVGLYEMPGLVNQSGKQLQFLSGSKRLRVEPNDTFLIQNPSDLVIKDDNGNETILTVQPDAFMKNLYVNGSRYFTYPMEERFTWARNFAVSVSSEYTAMGMPEKNAFVSLNVELMDSLNNRIGEMMLTDADYPALSEYAICITDGNGRVIALSDHINGINRPDPNDKADFNSIIRGENGYVQQSLLRKQIGNLNLLRMNPGPGSTLKPIIFSAIASQMNLDWDAFAAEGFSLKQKYFGGERVAEYDFEKNNGRIASVKDYLRLSDNYYHSNLLLLGSYSKQGLKGLLSDHFSSKAPNGQGDHWPYFQYKGTQYWLNGFKNWPGYEDGKANFGSDSSFVSIGLFENYRIYPYRIGKSFDAFSSRYDSSLFLNAFNKSGFIMPEFSLFDQKGASIDHRIPYDVFMSSFRGHVKGSSQVMIPPIKMAEAFGKLVSQNRNYSLTLNPYASGKPFNPFYTDNGVTYSSYLALMRESVFTGMKEALFRGTAGRLGAMLKNGSPYYYYAKTGTTGDDKLKEKSKLFVLIISEKDISDPDFNFRDNKFYTVYFTSQNGPPKQNEKFQAEIIRLIESSPVFKKYMAIDTERIGQ
ncbi:MAG: hypothetical protein H6549_10560 [Chitinophagales bacterium]|nr:hypothetical protein [Chitinophagales bacterium]